MDIDTPHGVEKGEIEGKGIEMLYPKAYQAVGSGVLHIFA